MRIPILSLAFLAVLAIVTPSWGSTWNGSANDDWFNPNNWTPTGVPNSGGTALISSGTVLITNQTAALAAFTNAGGTVSFSNWWAKIDATEIHLSSGTLKPNNAFTNNVMSNRVWLACANLTMDAGATINADGLGFDGVLGADGSGPGGGTKGNYRGSGGGYGGEGGEGRELLTPGAIYGDPLTAGQPGSAGGHGNNIAGSPGGGAIRIDATGAVEVNGIISANGAQGGYPGAGSGGGISITCNTIQGNGSLSAQGGNGAAASGGAGGGGRISLLYDETAQGYISVPSLALSTAPGRAYIAYERAELGTIYVPDNRFLGPVVSNLRGWWYTPGFTNWALNDLTLNACWLGFPSNSFSLTVTNDISGSGVKKLSFADNSDVHVGRDMYCNFSISGGGTFSVGRDLVVYALANYFEYDSFSFYRDISVGGSLTMSNDIYLYSRPATGGEDYGLLLAVSNDVVVASGAQLRPVSNPTNGVSPLITMNNLTVDNGGAINANGGGFMGRLGSDNGGQGYGPGGGLYYLTCGGGGGHGGRGSYGLRTDGRNGAGGVTNGLRYAPQWPGSAGGGGASTQLGQNGGGLIRISATDTVTVNGSITANGTTASVYSGAGSGGSIFITTGTFQATSTGLLQANGGNYSGNGGGFGGGGRITVWYGDIDNGARNLVLSGQEQSLGARFVAATSYTPFQGTTEVNKGVYTYTGYFAEGDATYDAEDGTVYFVTVLPPQGTSILIR